MALRWGLKPRQLLEALAKTSMFLRVGKTAPDTSPLSALVTHLKIVCERYRAPQLQHCVESSSGKGLRDAKKQGCFFARLHGCTRAGRANPSRRMTHTLIERHDT